MSHSRIPYSPALFNDYIQNTNGRLQATNPVTSNPYYQDYNISVPDSKDWDSRCNNWVTTVYATYINPATSTAIAKEDVKNFITEFHTFGGPLLNKILASGIAGSTEEHIFNFVLDRSDPTHSTTPIAAQCIAGIHGMGMGMYEFGCKGNNKDGRNSKVHGADSVQFAYALSALPPAPSPTPDSAGMVKELSTSATFTHDFGTDSPGKWLTVYFRWYNTKHPQLAGAWSSVQTLAIG